MNSAHPTPTAARSAPSAGQAQATLDRTIMLTLDRGRALESSAACDFGAVTFRPLDRGRRLAIRVPFTAIEQVFYRLIE